jgi:hypothetical protein
MSGGRHQTHREPAARFLPSDEHWQPRTWTRFRYAVLKKIYDSGAHSASELYANPPTILFLPLNRAEIRATLDSARRRGLIAPLHPGAVQLSNREEWILTEEGRRAIRHGLPWLMEKMGGLPKSLSAIVALLGSLGLGRLVSQWFKDHDSGDVMLVVFLLVAVVVIAGSALLAARSRDTGVNTRKAVVRDWRRWAVERPQWHEIATSTFPWWWALAAVVYFFVSTFLVGLVPAIHESDFLSFLTFAPIWAVGAPLLDWYNRWDDIEAKAAEARRAEAAEMPAVAA